MPEPQVEVLEGDARARLRELPSDFVHAVVTSPPFWKLRDYGTPPQTWADGWVGELGQEPHPDQFVEHLVEVFEEVRRVLRPDGVAFVDMDDTYCANRTYQVPSTKAGDVGNASGMRVPEGLKPKELALVPQRLALALQRAGWWVRCDGIWNPTNAMTESVTDRPSRAHEYIFMLTKSQSYFWDQEAVREPFSSETRMDVERSSYPPGSSSHVGVDGERVKKSDGGLPLNLAGRNCRSVWTMPTESYPGAHYAVMAKSVAEKCILAATSEKGACERCGAAVVRIVERESIDRNELPPDHAEWRPGRYDSGKAGDPQSPGAGQRYVRTRTVGWRMPCECDSGTTPCVVLDPFGGAMTTALVAKRLGRSSIAIELSDEAVALGNERLETWWKDVTPLRGTVHDDQMKMEVA